MFNSDLYQGMDMIEHITYRQTQQIVDDVHYELRVFFAIYVVQIVIVLYYFLFRTTIRAAFSQVKHARRFVGYLPLYLFTCEEQNFIRTFSSTAPWTMRELGR